MALREVASSVRFAGGIESKMDPKAVPTARLLALENAVFTRAVSLSKRFGYTSLGLAVLGAATPYALPRGLAARGDEVVLFTEAAPYSYVEGASAWSEIADGCQSIRQTDRALVKTTSSQTGADYAVCDGIALSCWADSRGGVYYTLGDAAPDGRITIAPTQASSTGSVPRAVRCGSKLALLWAEAALGQVKIIIFDPASPHTYDATQFPRALVDDLVVATPNFDAAYVNDTSTGGVAAAAFAWHSTAGMRWGWLDPSGVIGSLGLGWPGAVTFSVVTATVSAGPSIAVLDSASDAWGVAWANGADVTAKHLTSDGYGSVDPFVVVASNTTAAAGTIQRIAVGLRSSLSTVTADIWAEHRDATVRNSVVYATAFSTSTTLTAGPTFRGACLASCAWTDTPTGGTARGYVNLLHPAALFSSYFAVRDDGVVVAQTIPGNAGEPPGHTLPRVMDIDGDRAFEWAAIYRARLPLAAGADETSTYGEYFAEAGPRLVSLDFDADDAHQTVYVGRTLYLAGAVTTAYDGVGWVEAAPLYAPDWEAGATLHTAGSGGGIDPGTYSYVAWYEATLATGEIIRGPVSKPYSVTVTSGSDDRITFGWPTLRLTAWGRGGREHCRIGVARSLVGDASVYYRISSLDPSTAGQDNGYVANTQSLDTAAFVDVYPDAVIAMREPLYTTGGIPSNDPIATSGVIAQVGGRVFLGDASNPDALYFSQERADGYALEVTPELRIVVPPGDGVVTGVGDLDGAKAIFKTGAIYSLTGAGPLPNPAAGGEWSTPQRITSDVGCIDQRSIVTTPMGLMFQSAKGIYQLDRGGNATYIGAPVEAYNDLRVVRATLIEDANEVRFLTSTVTLSYNYLFGQWSTFTNHGGIDAVNAASAYHYLRADGRVFRQSAAYADDNLQIPMVIETAWIRFDAGKLQGLQRIWHAQILGTWKSAHRLFVQYMTDYDVDGNWSNPVPVAGFDALDMGGSDYGDGNYGDGNYGGDSPSPYQFSIHVGKKCQAIRFRYTFVEAVGAFGACAELTEMVLTGGVKGDRNKIPEARMG